MSSTASTLSGRGSELDSLRSKSLSKALSTTNLIPSGNSKESHNVPYSNAEVADERVLRQVYNHYHDVFGRPPLIPGHLRDFGNNFSDVNITWYVRNPLNFMLTLYNAKSSIHNSRGSAKSFLDKLRSTASAASQSSVKPLMQSQNSVDLVDKKVTVATVEDEKEELALNTVDLDEMTDIEVTFASQTTLEILHGLKQRVISAVKTADDVDSALHS